MNISSPLTRKLRAKRVALESYKPLNNEGLALSKALSTRRRICAKRGSGFVFGEIASELDALLCLIPQKQPCCRVLYHIV